MKKKITVIFLSIILSLMLVFPAFAMEQGTNVGTINETFELEVFNYLKIRTPKYLVGMGYSNDGTYEISYPHRVATDDGYLLYISFVFKDGATIGELLASVDEERISATFIESCFPEIDIAYQQSQVVGFCRDNSNMLLVSKSGVLALAGSENLEDLTFSYALELSMAKLDLHPIVLNSESIMPMAEYAKTARVGIVRNGAIGGVGICWAACVASIVNYRANRTGDAVLTAQDVYYDMYDEYMQVPSGTHVWKQRAYSYYGFNTTLVEAPSVISVAKVYNALNAGKPVHWGIAVGSTNQVLHGVVLWQIYYSDVAGDGAFVQIMDPNKSVYVSLDIFASTASTQFTFSYQTNAGTYNRLQSIMY